MGFCEASKWVRGMQFLQLRFASFRMTPCARMSFAFAKLVGFFGWKEWNVSAREDALGFFASLRMTA